MAKLLRKHLANQTVSHKISLGNVSKQMSGIHEKDNILATLVNMYIEMNNLIANAAVQLNSSDSLDVERMLFENEVEKLLEGAKKIWDLFVRGINTNQPPILVIKRFNDIHLQGLHQIQNFINTINTLTDI